MPDPSDRPPAPSKPPVLVTDTGEHPALVIQPEPRGRVLAGLLLDFTVLVGLMVLIGIDKITPEAGLPWIALILGVKARSVLRRNGPTSGVGTGAILSILGILGRGAR
jgi:hypothetical protein